jgi:acetyl/propionyl-CoA carboxylase alpha subunit
VTADAVSRQINIKLGSREYSVILNGGTVEVNGQIVHVADVQMDDDGGIVIHSGSRVLRAVMEAGEKDGLVTFGGREISLSYETERHRLLKRFASVGQSAHGHADLKASMPGMVVRIVAQAGSEVKKGQPVLILEAMKMENEIRAPIDGRVRDVRVAQGQVVEKGDLLMVFDS